MNPTSSGNEGFRILDEFACEAIPDPSILSRGGPDAFAKRSTNEGILAECELAADAVDNDDQPSRSDADIHMSCPQCQERLRIKASCAGHRGRCCSCGAVFVVRSG
jgi:hypothetical protein